MWITLVQARVRDFEFRGDYEFDGVGVSLGRDDGARSRLDAQRDLRTDDEHSTVDDQNDRCRDDHDRAPPGHHAGDQAGTVDLPTADPLGVPAEHRQLRADHHPLLSLGKIRNPGNWNLF